MRCSHHCYCDSAKKKNGILTKKKNKIKVISNSSEFLQIKTESYFSLYLLQSFLCFIYNKYLNEMVKIEQDLHHNLSKMCIL